MTAGNVMLTAAALYKPTQQLVDTIGWYKVYSFPALKSFKYWG
jgi:hypothetical protein